jgi:hypothetical protein
MSKVEELEKAIEALPDEEYVQLRQWFSEKDWHKWDQQIEEDSKSGKLNFLMQEALEAKSKNKLREL